MDGLSSLIFLILLFGFLLLSATAYGLPIQLASSQKLDTQNCPFPNVFMVNNGPLVSIVRPGARIDLFEVVAYLLVSLSPVNQQQSIHSTIL
ncbi:hypothetical protein GYMLUDRAFT_38253 [Collybiopsis luxurians FD-317 M1]|nr:hypothetical protein GYMLUDRAFT_38253 [Collybiopsis luxurians FD-317 M1]